MTDSCRKKVIFIVGPTAIGKTCLAVELAKKIGGEIISADSMQGYKGMDILSQKPAKNEQKKVPHHLISFLKAQDEYSAANFSKLARKKIEEIIKRQKTPIVVGGSGLYVKALIDGVFPSRGKDEYLRKELQRLAEDKGNLFLYNRLKKIDPASAAKIHPNDLKRVIRAIEIYELEKVTKTGLKEKTKGIKDKYDIKIFGLIADREKLYQRINKRVDLMFRKGLVKEVEKLLRGTLSITSSQALGIKEVKGFLEKEYGIAKAKEILKRNTRRFAKRQLTWFRPDSRIVWLDAGKFCGEEPAERIAREIA